jgi:cytochrome oxidase Cu insertion factor (SCO1/SenC/PrrC family)
MDFGRKIMSKKAIYFIFFISLCIGVGSGVAIKYLSPGPKAKAYEVAKMGRVSIGGNFDLIDFNGQKISNKDFHGKYLLVYFGFTFCPDVCPTALNHIKEALELLPDNTRKLIVPIFITIDPGRDTIQHLKNYMHQFDDEIIGLTGTEEQIEEAMKQYRVYSKKIENEVERENYLLDHSSFIYFMNKDGEYISHFGHNTSPEKLAEFINDKINGNEG